jgi:hypothetical protein
MVSHYPVGSQKAYGIEDQTGSRFWHDAIAKEMSNVMPAFEFIKCHLIFDIKSDLTRKERIVAGGHMTDEPHESVYSSVVYRDSVRIAFTIASLNGL